MPESDFHRTLFAGREDTKIREDLRETHKPWHSMSREEIARFESLHHEKAKVPKIPPGDSVSVKQKYFTAINIKLDDFKFNPLLVPEDRLVDNYKTRDLVIDWQRRFP